MILDFTSIFIEKYLEENVCHEWYLLKNLPDTLSIVFSLDFKRVSGNDLNLEKSLVERFHRNVKIG